MNSIALLLEYAVLIKIYSLLSVLTRLFHWNSWMIYDGYCLLSNEYIEDFQPPVNSFLGAIRRLLASLMHRRQTKTSWDASLDKTKLLWHELSVFTPDLLQIAATCKETAHSVCLSRSRIPHAEWMEDCYIKMWINGHASHSWSMDDEIKKRREFRLRF